MKHRFAIARLATLGRPMAPEPLRHEAERVTQRQRALSRWEDEGGAGPGRPFAGLSGDAVEGDATLPTGARMSHLHARVIALENLVIAMLADAPEHQLGLARDMAAYISPRAGFTRHPLTVHAAGEMISLIERSACFREPQPR